MAKKRAVQAKSAGPLKTVADAIGHEVEGMKEGLSAATARADEALPAVNGFVSRLVYTSSYAISYGVVFPSVLLARSIPKNNPIVHGLVDGAHGAVDMVDKVMKRKIAAKAE
jgi:hypothetical protein